MSNPTWILYGANGYTGELIAEEAVRRGMRPVLAGRNAERIRQIAERLGLEHRAFGLDDPAELDRQFGGTKLVFLAAGPFSRTSRPVVDACLRAGASYADITGEYPVFEAVFARDAAARDAGSTLIPGAGFDVVPSDCLAASLKAALPDANTLELAFAGSEGPSAGTAKTMLEGLPHGGAIRKNGRITQVPAAWKTRTVPFADRTREAVSIPWGDIATAYHSTGIANITTYMAAPANVVRAMRIAGRFGWLLGADPIQALLGRMIDRKVKGPDAERRRVARMYLWGRASSPAGEAVEGTLETPEAYQLTVLAGVEVASRLLAGDVEPGAKTPSMAFGAGFITEIDECDLRIGAPKRMS